MKFYPSEHETPWLTGLRSSKVPRPSAMELARGAEVWVRGAAFAENGLESRAERIAGRRWRIAIVKCVFLRQKRGGRVQVKVDSGETVWVGQEYLVSQNEGVRPGDNEGREDILVDQDLGSDYEDDKGQQEEQREQRVQHATSHSRRHQREGRLGWNGPTDIIEDQRFKDGYNTPLACHMVGLDASMRESVWGHFWAFGHKTCWMSLWP